MTSERRSVLRFGKALLIVTIAALIGGKVVSSQSSAPLPHFSKVLTVPGAEWRFNPLAVDLFRNGHIDLVATARLVTDALHMWSNDGKSNFEPIEPTWSDVGYAALATGDINGDGFPDVVAASHFGKVQTLLSDGKGGFTEQIFQGTDGYTAAQLVDINGDGKLDLILLGFRKAAIEIYFGDGKGNWKLHSSFPETHPGPSMPGRALAIGDINHDGHIDIVAAFQRWGIYIYYGDGRGGFTGGPVKIESPTREYKSLVLADVNKDGHLDMVINGIFFKDQPNGPDVYLGDGHGGWKASSTGLKVLKYPATGLAVGHVDGDRNLDIVAAGRLNEDSDSGWGLFWFKGDGQGGWHLVQDSGLPSTGLPVISSVTLADLYHDGSPDVIALSGTNGDNGSITVWKPGATSAHASK